MAIPFAPNFEVRKLSQYVNDRGCIVIRIWPRIISQTVKRGQQLRKPRFVLTR